MRMQTTRSIKVGLSKHFISTNDTPKASVPAQLAVCQTTTCHLLAPRVPLRSFSVSARIMNNIEMTSIHTSAQPQFFMPAETDSHAGIMMVWPSSASIEEDDTDRFGQTPGTDVGETRFEIASIAKTIAKYEPVHLFADRGVNGDAAQDVLGNVDNVAVHRTKNVFSLWARDTGPTFVRSAHGPVENSWGKDDDPGINLNLQNTSSEAVGLLLNFNQWGRKLEPNMDSYTAATTTQALRMSAVRAPFIAEGGAIEVDGEGTMLATESSIINPNRNPGISKEVIEQDLHTYLGIEKVIWIPGRRGWDITDDHIDALARFVSPGVVLLGKPFAGDPNNKHRMGTYAEAKRILSRATDARGRSFTIIDLEEPNPVKALGQDYHPASGPCLAYVNYLLVKDAVIMAAFDDEKADAAAKEVVQRAFPDRTVEQVRLKQLALQGGGIHCATQQIL